VGDLGFKPLADQISHMLQTTRHPCDLDVGPWRKAAGWASLTHDTQNGIKRV